VETIKKLAIIIPAYKPNFFEKTLESIAEQSVKEFTVYVGDDASPFNLREIIRKFENRIKIVYKRFPNNLGSSDLARHWNRCIDLAEKEEWIWLFSDDDTMDRNCVDLFYSYISTNTHSQLLHFNVDVIDAFDKVVRTPPKFPNHLSTTEFFTKRIMGALNSYAIEFIFRKNVYLSGGKFTSFDLGWNSDDATWMKFSLRGGIHTITGATCHWRWSGVNISSLVKDHSIMQMKVKASVSFLKWAKVFFDEHSLSNDLSDYQKYKARILTPLAISSLSFYEKWKIN
jgi:glycosyltransferase involved in cell wall biosynthesis